MSGRLAAKIGRPNQQRLLIVAGTGHKNPLLSPDDRLHDYEQETLRFMRDSDGIILDIITV